MNLIRSSYEPSSLWGAALSALADAAGLDYRADAKTAQLRCLANAAGFLLREVAERAEATGVKVDDVCDLGHVTRSVLSRPSFVRSE